MGCPLVLVLSLETQASKHFAPSCHVQEFCRLHTCPSELRKRVMAQLGVRFSNKRVLDEAHLLLVSMYLKCFSASVLHGNHCHGTWLFYHSPVLRSLNSHPHTPHASSRRLTPLTIVVLHCVPLGSDAMRSTAVTIFQIPTSSCKLSPGLFT